MNPNKHKMHLLKQHSESFKSWSAIIRINTEGISWIVKLGPGVSRLSKALTKFTLEEVPCTNPIILQCIFTELSPLNHLVL